VGDPSLVRFRAVVQGAYDHLESRRSEVNDLNVFPVADGDTGDNMALTLRAVLDELDRLAQAPGEATLDEIGRDDIVESVARAALLGARGNSGVILSQLIRGAAEELVSRPGELVDPALLSAALARAAQRAYESVRQPAEGTMLTVMRDMAASTASQLAHMPQTRLEPGADAATQNALIADVLERALVAGEESVNRGPQLLAVLAEAGVVDAGGYAVTVLVAGVIAALRGTLPPPVAHQRAPARATQPEHSSETYRYCVNFAVRGHDLHPATFVGALEAIGDSVLVVGDATTLRVHVHADDPEVATVVFTGRGDVSRLEVADMHEQVARRAARLAAAGDPGATWSAPLDGRRCAVLAVCAGDGVAALFHQLGAQPLDGGPTLNPSTDELLQAIDALGASDVVVLPNSPNVVMAAEHAGRMASADVVVVPTRSPQAGLAAAVAIGVDADADAASVAAAMVDALEHVRTGGVAPAARPDPAGRFVIGDAVGYVEEELVAWGEPTATLRDALARLADGAELVTCIAGDEPPIDDDAVGALAPAGVELEVSHGGQPSWWWLLSAE
jgi:DAK2 domain fusion protein YloV